jgi:hypothetical protein
MMILGLDESEVNEQHKWAMLDQTGKVDKVDLLAAPKAPTEKSGCV